MSEATVETLFDEFALRYVRGERPNVGAYLARAAEGPDRDDLANLIDRFLQAAPARKPSEEEVVLMQARLDAEPPLLFLRRRRKLSRATVVDALVSRLGLDPGKREKVRAYFHELETGLLDPEPVDRRVWEVLADVFRANAQQLAALRPPPAALADAAYLRRQDAPELAAPAPDYVRTPAEAPDEVDTLFTGSA